MSQRPWRYPRVILLPDFKREVAIQGKSRDFPTLSHLGGREGRKVALPDQSDLAMFPGLRRNTGPERIRTAFLVFWVIHIATLTSDLTC